MSRPPSSSPGKDGEQPRGRSVLEGSSTQLGTSYGEDGVPVPIPPSLTQPDAGEGAYDDSGETGGHAEAVERGHLLEASHPTSWSSGGH